MYTMARFYPTAVSSRTVGVGTLGSNSTVRVIPKRSRREGIVCMAVIADDTSSYAQFLGLKDSTFVM